MFVEPSVCQLEHRSGLVEVVEYLAVLVEALQTRCVVRRWGRVQRTKGPTALPGQHGACRRQLLILEDRGRRCFAIDAFEEQSLDDTVRLADHLRHWHSSCACQPHRCGFEGGTVGALLARRIAAEDDRTRLAFALERERPYLA